MITDYETFNEIVLDALKHNPGLWESSERPLTKDLLQDKKNLPKPTFHSKLIDYAENQLTIMNNDDLIALAKDLGVIDKLVENDALYLNDYTNN